MEGIPLLKDMLRKQNWLVKLDLKDAYLTVPVHPDSRNFLQFEWKDKKFQFDVLPFGLNCAPWVFTKLMKPLIGFWREKGVRLIIYLDDILIMNSSREAASGEFYLVASTLESVGFLIN